MFASSWLTLLFRARIRCEARTQIMVPSSLDGVHEPTDGCSLLPSTKVLVSRLEGAEPGLRRKKAEKDTQWVLVKYALCPWSTWAAALRSHGATAYTL